MREARDTLVPLPRLWWWLTCAAAVLAATASIVGLLDGGRIYRQETPALSDAATAQDLVMLVPVAPLLVYLGVRARHGSARALLCLPGLLAFAVYNYAIYAYSVHFGPLFLAWVAALGVSLFALVGILATTDLAALTARVAKRAMPRTAWFLVSVGTFFALLWLSEIVPELLAGRPSSSALYWNVPTNPVHVLDLAFFLPAVIISGLLLRRRHQLGYATVAGQLVWLALTAVPILVTPAVAALRGHASGWPVTLPIGALLLVTVVVLARVLGPGPVGPETDPGRRTFVPAESGTFGSVDSPASREP